MIDKTGKSTNATGRYRTSFRHKKSIASMMSLGLLVSLEGGFSQNALAQDGSGFGSFTIEEVTVTARKREESLQDAPLSVAAFTGEGIEQRGFTEISDVTQLVPNLVFDTSPPISGNQSGAAVFIRGVGQLDFTINVDPGVGTYIDGVYVARSVGGVIDLLDLERVEVLRGPQGTLFGRNTIGGAIQLVSKAPSDELGGYVSITGGTDNRADFLGVLNVPLTETLLSKVSLISKNRDGYVIDGNGSDLGDDNSISARLQLTWEASERLDFALALDGTVDRENGSPNVALNLFSNTRGLRTNTLPSGEGTLGSLPGLDPCDPTMQDTSRNCFGPAWLTGDRNKTESTFPAKSNNDIYGAALTVNYKFDFGDFKSITAYRGLDSNFSRDSDHSPFSVFATSNDQEQTQISQEFQLIGDSFQDAFHWVAGLYYFQEEASDDTRVFTPFADRKDPLNPRGGEATTGIFLNEVDNSNVAVYGEGTYDFSDKLHLTVGARYTDETKEYTTLQTVAFLVTPDQPFVTLVNDDASRDFTETTSRVTLSYDITDQIMTYLTYSEGFKSGGFNPRYLAPAPNGRAIAFNPEYVTLYEAGMKFINESNTVRINGAIFTNDYDDIQISTNPDFTGNATITQNAAQATISGAELELTWVPNAELLIEGGIGYLDASYDQFDPNAGIAFPVSNDFARVPELSANMAISYIYELGSGASITPRIDWAYKSEMQGSAENNPDIFQDEFSVVNTNVIFTDADNMWSGILGVTNLTDEDYLVSANANVGLGYAEGVYARERQVYLQVKRNF